MLLVIEELRLTPQEIEAFHARRAAMLAAMTSEEREAFYEAEEADALREALSDETWFQA